MGSQLPGPLLGSALGLGPSWWSRSVGDLPLRPTSEPGPSPSTSTLQPLGGSPPTPPHPPPHHGPLPTEAQRRPYYADYSPTRRSIHSLCTSHYLDLFITFIIGVNVITMSMEHYNQPKVGFAAWIPHPPCL